jgi:hypothetical protein
MDSLTVLKWVLPPFITWGIPKLCGIKITTPVVSSVVKAGNVEVRGDFRWELGFRFRLFRKQGKQYWPQGSPDFDPKTHTWKSIINVGGTPGQEHTIIIAAVDPELQDLLEHYKHAHDATSPSQGWTPFTLYTVPKGIKELDRVTVTQLDKN